MRLFALLLAAIGCCTSVLAQTGCPGCVVDLPTLPEDTLYLSAVSNGEVGVYYDHSLSFRLPKTTTPVNAIDPNTPAGLTITSITLTSLSDVPPGLSWEASQTAFNPANETDGCIRFCGTPIQSDTFFVLVTVSVQISIISQNASFVLPIYIAPATGGGEGFTMSNNIGCAEAIVSFTNNLPSNGDPGITYMWDFGNGNQTTDENPEGQFYYIPGTYPVTYTATFDTVGYFMNSVTITSADCEDILVAPFIYPDLFVNILSPSGQLLAQSSILTDATFPATFSFNVELEPGGDYAIEVWDEDSGLLGDDDLCGVFTVTNETEGPLSDMLNGSDIDFNIVHPVSTVTSVDSVIVYPEPDAPTITADQTVFCGGGAATLSSSSTTGNQWMNAGANILGATGQVLTVVQSGSYSIYYTDANGCPAISEVIEVTVNPLPATPLFYNNANVLTVFTPDALPAEASLVWMLNGAPVGDDTTSIYLCITQSGIYSLTVTDLVTGCSSVFTTEVAYNPQTPCFVSAENTLANQLRVWPNPGTSVQLHGLPESGRFEVLMFDIAGRNVGAWRGDATEVNNALMTESENLSAGTYLLQVRTEQGEKADFRWIKM